MTDAPASTEGNAYGSLRLVLAPGRPRAVSTACNLAVLLKYPGSSSFLRRLATRLWPFRCSRRGSPAKIGLGRAAPREISVIECAPIISEHPLSTTTRPSRAGAEDYHSAAERWGSVWSVAQADASGRSDATCCPNSRKKPLQKLLPISAFIGSNGFDSSCNAMRAGIRSHGTCSSCERAVARGHLSISGSRGWYKSRQGK